MLKAAIIGIVEGVTEFLPVSSTGHMIIVGNLINFQSPTYPKEYVDMFEIVMQLLGYCYIKAIEERYLFLSLVYSNQF